jgi:hypothetical protein
MRALLLTATALLLATGVAQAEWQCPGDITVSLEKLTSDHLAELKISEFYVKDHPKLAFSFSVGKRGARLNGKRCKEK